MMEIARGLNETVTKTKINPNVSNDYTYEVIVVEDNHLTNTILSKALNSTINAIYNLKNIAIKFSSFKNGGDFLNYFKVMESPKSKLIVFSDYHLEDNMNGVEILKNVKQERADATVIIMSDSTNNQIAVDAENMGAYCFLPKNNKTTVVCSELLFQMVK